MAVYSSVKILKVLSVLIIGCTCIIFYLTWTWPISSPHDKTLVQRSTPYHGQQVPLANTKKKKTRKSLYVAVLTCPKYLDSRAVAVNNTWSRLAPAVDFYIGEGSTTSPLNLPIVSLPGTDDSYPPQKKVFRMYRYIYDNYINEFDWFMRADDDVYVRIPQLIEFLSKMDPEEPLYIGSPGRGRKNDLSRLKLKSTDAYCMGGPGIVMSRKLLMELVVHLDDCLNYVVVSYDDDVEIGRCIMRKLAINCTNAYNHKMSKLFYQDYSNGSMFTDVGTLKPLSKRMNNILANVLTFHPLKTKQKMYSLHETFLQNYTDNNFFIK